MMKVHITAAFFFKEATVANHSYVDMPKHYSATIAL
jgi:hypothetical protein